MKYAKLGKGNLVSFFAATFFGLFALLVVLALVLWWLYRENIALKACLKHARAESSGTLREAEYFRIACESASDGILIQDLKARIIWANAAYGRIHGLDTTAIVGRSPLEFALPKDQTPSPEEIAAFRFDPADPKWDNLELVQNERGDGTIFWNQISVSFNRSADGRENAILICRDVTEQVERQDQLQDISQRLEHEATHDGLTDVSNRAAFLNFIDAALKAKDRGPLGLLHIDLDNFKNVNDTHGHSGGDAVLRRTARVISDHIRTSDLVARVGGDEFVVVCPNAHDLAFLDTLSTRLIDAIGQSFEWSNRVLKVEASIGAAISVDKYTTAQDLLLQSDFALYEAKRAGRNQVALYDEDLHARHAFQNRRAADLAEAINTGTLEYYFQPTQCLTTGNIAGVETLVRWKHPTDGIIQPEDFLPIVNDLGLLAAMDMLSMKAAIAEKRRLNLAGFTDIHIAFNASPEVLGHPDFINSLVWGVEAADIDRAHVTIEVLETTDFGDSSKTTSHAAIIHDLRQAGFQVHLDDFGIGFAGLSHLATLAVTGVKIDRGLVTDLHTDSTNRKILRKIIELSNDLGLTVIAEGVEDQRTVTTLKGMGCGIIQGYWLSAPMAQDDLHDWLRNRALTPQIHHA